MVVWSQPQISVDDDVIYDYFDNYQITRWAFHNSWRASQTSFREVMDDLHMVTNLLWILCQNLDNVSSSKMQIRNLLPNLQYKPHQISKLKCFSSRFAIVFAQSIEARC